MAKSNAQRLLLSNSQADLPPAVADSVALSSDAKPLPEGYQPSDFDVICGRGKGSYNQHGSKRFRALLETYFPTFLLTKSRADKAKLFNQIIDETRSDRNGNARFVKYVGDQWIEISESETREKVAHTLRKLKKEGQHKVSNQTKHTGLKVKAKGETIARSNDTVVFSNIQSSQTVSANSQNAISGQDRTGRSLMRDQRLHELHSTTFDLDSQFNIPSEHNHSMPEQQSTISKDFALLESSEESSYVSLADSVQSVPNHIVQWVPNHGVQSVPNHGVQPVPNHGVQSVPNHGVQSVPNHGVQSVPNHGLQSVPNHGLQSVPNFPWMNSDPNLAELNDPPLSDYAVCSAQTDYRHGTSELRRSTSIEIASVKNDDALFDASSWGLSESLPPLPLTGLILELPDFEAFDYDNLF